jgi:hypothetical protein
LPTPTSAAVLEWLGRAAARERSWLEFARCEGSEQRLKELVRAPARIRATEIQIQNEAVTRSANARWKLPRIGGGILPERLVRWRQPAVSIRVQTASTSAPQTFESSPPEGIYAVLKTKTDDKHGWLAAGQTLGGLLLHARSLGLSCTPFPNALHQPQLRAELRTTIGHKGFMQVIVCFDATKAEWLPRVNEVYETLAPRAP